MGEGIFPFAQLGRTKWRVPSTLSPHFWILLLPGHRPRFLLFHVGFLLVSLPVSTLFLIPLWSDFMKWELTRASSVFSFPPPPPNHPRLICVPSLHSETALIPVTNNLQIVQLTVPWSLWPYWAFLLPLFLLAGSPSYISMQHSLLVSSYPPGCPSLASFTGSPFLASFTGSPSSLLLLDCVTPQGSILSSLLFSHHIFSLNVTYPHSWL